MTKLVEEGKNRYEKALEKSKLLLEKTMNTLKVTHGNVNGKTGYKVRGISKTDYLVENNLKVWKVNGTQMEYKCIVDKTHAGQMGKDALVSRLYALSNDVLIAKDVYTLKV